MGTVKSRSVIRLAFTPCQHSCGWVFLPVPIQVSWFASSRHNPTIFFKKNSCSDFSINVLSTQVFPVYQPFVTKTSIFSIYHADRGACWSFFAAPVTSQFSVLVAQNESISRIANFQKVERLYIKWNQPFFHRTCVPRPILSNMYSSLHLSHYHTKITICIQNSCNCKSRAKQRWWACLYDSVLWSLRAGRIDE